MHGNRRVHRINPDSRNSHVRSNITSLFITNFSDSIQVGDIQRVCRQACNRLGKLVGVFIAKTLSKSGKRFCFIRFLGLGNCDSLIIQFREVWFGSYKRFASLPRSLEKKNVRTSQTIGFSTAVHCDVSVNSYANMVRGSANDMRNSKNMEEIIELTSGHFIVEKKNKENVLLRQEIFPHSLISGCYAWMRDLIILK